MWSDATKLPCSFAPLIPGIWLAKVVRLPIMDWVGVWRYRTSLEQRKRDISCDDLC